MQSPNIYTIYIYHFTKKINVNKRERERNKKIIYTKDWLDKQNQVDTKVRGLH